MAGSMVKHVCITAQEEIWDLPDEILIEILTTWVSLADLSRCDAACCSTNSRPRFLEIVGSENFSVPKTRCCDSYNDYFRWHASRRIKCRKFVLYDRPQLDNGVLETLLAKVGGTAIKSVDLCGMHDMVNPALQLLRTHQCTAIERISVIFKFDEEHFYRDVRIEITELLWLLTACSETITSIKMNGFRFRATIDVPIFTLKNLTRLNLTGMGSYHALAPYLVMSHMTHVTLQNDAIDDAGLVILSRQASCLRELAIGCCWHITDLGMARLAAACSALRVLMVCECESLTDGAVIPFLRQCLNLETVYLQNVDSRAHSFTDIVLLALARSCGQRLRHLALLGFTLEGGSGINALVRACTSLETLYMTVSDPVTSSWVGRVIRAQGPTLKEVHLNNTKVTGNVLDAIAYHGDHLRVLGIPDITGADGPALARMAQRCTALETLHTGPIFTALPYPIREEAVRAFWQVISPRLKFVDEYQDHGPEFWNTVRPL